MQQPPALRLPHNALGWLASLPFLCALWLGLASPAQAEGYAVLVGVGKYQHPGIGRLNGPPHDVQKIKNLLTQRYGYNTDNIRILIDEQATKANITQAMRWLASVAAPNDGAVFYFSGHGSRVNDTNGDEKDGFDETVIPYDVGPSPSSHLIDDEIGDWIATVRSRKLTVLLDSCHSGTGFKSLPGAATAKYWENPYLKPVPGTASKNFDKRIGGFRAIRVRTRVSVETRVRIQTQPARYRRPAVVQLAQTEAPIAAPNASPNPRPRFTFIAAALSNQFAYDVGAPTHSVFTHYLVQEAQSHTNITSLVASINQQIGGRWPMTVNADGYLGTTLFFHAASGPVTIPPPTPENSRRVCNGRFCATLSLLNKNSTQQTRFRHGDEIRFALHLNRPGYIFLINIPVGDEPAILFPDAYYQLLGQNKFDYKIRRANRWKMLPDGGSSSPAYFRIEGKPHKEFVELIAFESHADLMRIVKQVRDILEKHKNDPPSEKSKRIGVALRANQQTQPQRRRRGARMVVVRLPYWIVSE